MRITRFIRRVRKFGGWENKEDKEGGEGWEGKAGGGGACVALARPTVLALYTQSGLGGTAAAATRDCRRTAAPLVAVSPC